MLCGCAIAEVALQVVLPHRRRPSLAQSLQHLLPSLARPRRRLHPPRRGKLLVALRPTSPPHSPSAPIAQQMMTMTGSRLCWMELYSRHSQALPIFFGSLTVKRGDPTSLTLLLYSS